MKARQHLAEADRYLAEAAEKIRDVPDWEAVAALAALASGHAATAAVLSAQDLDRSGREQDQLNEVLRQTSSASDEQVDP